MLSVAEAEAQCASALRYYALCQIKSPPEHMNQSSAASCAERITNPHSKVSMASF